jgi:3',5'-cyclic-nucleotide phosphodiesterase
VYSEIQSQNFSKLVIPVVVLSGFDPQHTPSALNSPSFNGSQHVNDPVRLVRYLDAGAVDVFPSPLTKHNVHALAVHAYRVHKEMSQAESAFLTTKRNRKLSWVGMNDEKPYAYLREAMVSSLMSGICNPETVGDSLDPRDVVVSEERQEAIAAAIGTWSFSAHEFTDDELLYGGLLMLKHALQMPGLEQWIMDDDDLIVFLQASRIAYNEFVLYHNFRHVSDVLQALFYSLVQIGTLPPYPPGSERVAPKSDSPIAQLLSPFDALTLLISAIGHDVGHPGVNNAFLVALNAPLAQLYNDRSVLESFHCAAYSQILRRYWPKAFSDASMRKLMINSILATDMGLHFKYMADLGSLQQKIAHDKGIIDGWNDKTREEHKDLACGLLIKCADISNVARKFEVAAKWANILTDEFSSQGVMEQALQVPSCLFGGPPVRDDLIKLGQSQIGFINIFARPLFESVADILPGMKFAVDEMIINKATWEKKMEETRQKQEKMRQKLGIVAPSYSPEPSPFSGSPQRIPSDGTLQAADPNHFATSPNSILQDSNHSSNAELSTTGSSPVPDKSTSIPGVRSPTNIENQSQSRRGSADPNLTAILVTQTPKSSDKSASNSSAESAAYASRKDTLTRQSPQELYVKSPDEMGNGGARPLTAPSHTRRSQGTANLFPMPRSSQSHSEVDLSQTVNGNADGASHLEWDAAKASADSNQTRSDASRTSAGSEWWRLGRRRTRESRKCDTDTRGQQKPMLLDPPVFDANSNTSPTTPSPGRTGRSGKLKSFFTRKPKSGDQEKQLSSFGSSSQLRTPPTSDPGLSVNSED